MAVRGRKEERLETRLPAEAKQQIEYAADLQGRSVSDFVVTAALEQAAKVIEQQRVIRLSIEESVALAKIMIDEPRVNSKAVAAMRRHKELMG